VSTNEVGAPHPRRLRSFADRWAFRRKLNILVGVPLTVLAVLLAYLITDQLAQSQDAADAARLVRNSTEVATLVDRVEAEHQQAILLSVRHEATYDGGTPAQTAYREAQVAVDQQVEKVREAFGDRLPAGEAQALREVNGLESLRNTIEQNYLPADNIDPAYANANKGLIDGLGLDRNASLAATFTGSLLDSLLRADAAHSAFETGVFSATTGDSNALIEFIGAIGAAQEYAHQADRFARFATPAQAEELGGIEYSRPQATVERQYAELQIDPGGLQAESATESRQKLRAALDSYSAYREQAGIRLGITTSLIDEIADRADEASDDAAWRAGLLLSLALFGFALWLAFAVLVRRSVVRPVQALTGAAREVADVAGRELARVADDDAEESGPPRLRDVPVTAQDEIGDLAEAFNHVQTTAAALLERQVLSRRNVAEMFGNVGRRVSNLTARQLALIDAVERGETDPALLERLYSIDHIAVRLRRNADSLMLLAGLRETVVDAGPSALTNVVRVALGQIEGFQRVELRARTEIRVEPDVIGDLTLMVAELVENAVSFSPEGTPVEVTVANGDGGAVIVVADHGLGMSAERLAEENARLIRRERLDLVPTKVLGLFVVGTLARRWEISVALSRTPGGGVTAEVTVPSALLVEPGTIETPAITAPTATAAGPQPSTTLQAATDDLRPLPRRVSRREETPGDEPSQDDRPPQETQPQDRPSVALPSQGRLSQGRLPEEDGPSEDRPSADRPSQDRPSEDRAQRHAPARDAAGRSDDDPSETPPSQDPLSAGQPSQDRLSENRPSQDQPSEGRPSQRRPSEDRAQRHDPARDAAGRSDDDPSETRPPQDPLSEGQPSNDQPSQERLPADHRPSQDQQWQGGLPQDGPSEKLPSHARPGEEPARESALAPRTRPGEKPFVPQARAGDDDATAVGHARADGPDPSPTHRTSDTAASPTARNSATPPATPAGTGASPAASSTGTGATPAGTSTSPTAPSTGTGATPAARPTGTDSPTPRPAATGATPTPASAMTGPTPTSPPAPGGAPGGARPLRRRVRGATLRTTADAAQQALRRPARPADAEAVRAALDEFEAAVERAHRDSTAGGETAPPTTTPPMQDQNHLPEGAEQ
jgi:signal transduction histidine kinase